MESYENRIINGVLKANLIANDPAAVQTLLARDVEIIIAPERMTWDDLWPCAWALAQVLERQFTGRIFLRCGFTVPLPAPARFSTRTIFNSEPATDALQIYVGIEPPANKTSHLWGDARGAQLSYRALLDNHQPANPISGFALAGYLGFAALATAVGMPAMRESFARDTLLLPMAEEYLYQHPADGYTLIGLGQLGQAYLSLLYFLTPQQSAYPRVVLLDKDRFEKPNRHTQILLEETALWEGHPKATFLCQQLQDIGWPAKGEVAELNWGWEKPLDHPALVLLGLDNFDARRMALHANYAWYFEAGVGTSFLAPKVSWHSVAPAARKRRLFPSEIASKNETRPETTFEQTLYQASGDRCGWVRYNTITATAPALGLVASAYVWSEITQYLAGRRESQVGRAALWCPLLPFLREDLRQAEPSLGEGTPASFSAG